MTPGGALHPSVIRNNVVIRLIAIIYSVMFSVVSMAGNSHIQEVVFETILKGGDSYYKVEKGNFIEEFHDQESWQKFWRAHTSKFYVKEPAPIVDFSSEYVIALFDQRRPSGGFNVEIVKVIVDKSIGGYPYNVGVEMSYPGSGTMVGAAEQRQFHLIKVVRQQ